MQRHQEQRRADTSALVDEARGQMPELPEFDLLKRGMHSSGQCARPDTHA